MRIGIIGGGQLGMMMAEAAKKYNVEVIGLDPNPICPLSLVADKMIIGEYNDACNFEQMLKEVDVITYEFENVDLDLVKKYEEFIPQKAAGLYYSKNRLVEKNYVNKLGIPTANFEKYANNSIFEGPIIIKTTTGGYDGKGQYLIKNEIEFNQFQGNENEEYIIEELIHFDYEISMIVSRDKNNKVVSYPVPINSHVNGILFTSLVDGNINEVVIEKAKKYSNELIRELDYVGTLAIEYFVVGDKVIFNEFAPRPHNSGHYTIEACTVSQFENHIRAIIGLDVIETKLIYPSLMINVLGQDVSRLFKDYEDNVYIHDYHKAESKENRKMGHITIVESDVLKLIEIKNKIVED